MMELCREPFGAADTDGLVPVERARRVTTTLADLLSPYLTGCSTTQHCATRQS